MKKISENNYCFKSDLKLEEIKERLLQRTLLRESLGSEWTSKDFIGMINNNNFKVIGSSMIPSGAAAIIKGEVYENEGVQINVTTKLHHGFKILFYIFIVLLVIGFLLNLILNPYFKSPFTYFFGSIFGVAFFRVFLHVTYAMARNIAIKRLTSILELHLEN